MIRAAEQCACPITEIGPTIAGACSSQFVLFMTLLEAFINGRCDLADPCNRVASVVQLDEAYDFVVVGGGTAGAVVAARLSENPQWKVLLIEAGGDEPIPSSVPAFVTAYWGQNETDWKYSTEKQENACLNDGGVCSYPRGKMLGGCSVINGMMYMRGVAADYDAWAVNGATNWSWIDVFPYFLKSEDNREIGAGVSSQYHSTGGPMPVGKFRWAPQFAHDVVAASIELGYPPTSDLNGDSITGFAIAQTMNADGSRYSTARAFLRPAAHRQNLHVLLNAHVTRVVATPILKTVTAVEYMKDGVIATVGVKKEAILSAGTINTPQILLLSGIGPRETLEKFNIPSVHELPGVGQNFHNHVGVDLEFELSKEADVDVLNWAAATEYLLKREGPLASTTMSQLTGKVNSRFAAAGGRHPDIQFFFSGYYASCGGADVMTKEEEEAVEARRTMSISAINLHPLSRGYVTLQSTDPLQPPLMQPNYFYRTEDIEVLVDAAKIAYRLANTTILREKYGMAPKPGYGDACEGGGANPTDDFFRCLVKRHTAPENHQVGTCKMGPASDVMAVVDMELKVHGMKGLRVMDGSIIPSVTSGNTAAPIIMIAERGAQFIITQYQKSKSSPTDTDSRFDVDFNPDEGGYVYEPPNTVNGFNDGFGSNEQRFTDNQPNKPNRWKPWDKNWQHPQWQTKPGFSQDWHKKHEEIANQQRAR